MNSPRLLIDIQNQPASLDAVLGHQSGPGAQALREAAGRLKNARRVVITGMGASLFASIPLEYRLCSQGLDASAIETGEALHYRSALYRDAVVVVVSRSGESVEIAKLLPELRQRATVIGVSNDPQSTLARLAHIPLHIASLPDEMVAIQSYTGTVLTLALLGAAVCGNLEETAAASALAIERLGPFISRGVAELGIWDGFLRLSSPVHLLGRGPSCGSALEGALLFNETAKFPAAGMPAASFRHGPVELVDGNFVGFVFAPEDATRHLNLALADDLRSFGGRVCGIGPSAAAEGVLWRETPCTPAELAPLVEIVPVQLAALRLAQLRGLQVGHFRYTPQVTRDESRILPAGRPAVTE